MWDPLFFVEVLIGGLLSGVMYSLVALGFVLIYKASGVFNFAQGALVLFAALTFVLLLEVGGEFWNWTAWLSLLFAFAAGVLYVRGRNTEKQTGYFSNKWIAVGISGLMLLLLAMFFGAEGGLSLPSLPTFTENVAAPQTFQTSTGSPMWRASFVVLLVFLVIVLAMRKPQTAAAILLAVALLSLLGGGIVFWRAMALTLVIMIILAIAIEGVVLRPLVNQEPIILFMATIGLNFVLEGMAQGVWDADVHGLEIGIDDISFEVGGIYISQFDIFAAVTAGIIVTVLAVFFNRTRVGRALRAVADDHQAAMSVGIPLQNIWAIVWATAGIVALVAGLLWGSKLGVQFSLALLAFKALPVLILGGFTSVPGAIVGGLIVGATEKLFEFFIGIPFLGGGTESWSPYMLAMIFLLFRPQGLFGEKIIERV